MNEERNILVVDDSALMRRVMSDIIKSDKRLQVADTARNGLEALDLLKRGKKYDLIVLDINMPQMDGVAFLEELNKQKMQEKILIVSAIASQSAKETIRALELGAFDFVRKPDGFAEVRGQNFKEELLTQVLLAVNMKAGLEQDVDWKTISELNKRKPVLQTGSNIRTRSGGSDKLVFIASSTGGPKSLQEVVPIFPRNFPYPIVIIQHMPEGFTGSLAKRLDEVSPLTVQEADDGMIVQKGHVYIAKGGYQLYLQQNRSHYSFAVRRDPPRGGLRPCADIFLESLAESSFAHVVCAVLTGMGADATKGLDYLVRYRNLSVVAQDEATSIVYGMPRAVKAAGLVDEVVPLGEIANAIIKKVGE
ncbi:MAG: chemotaxis-specific protein-glutamate methyltransferase CheB [Lachnoclostridium sp.]|jgi:two-component system chemotaxis response regulator CheB|nr:chemotaxis-specific protein-glutamate methyltransferase CheB [Lachnoclostridium sp.]